MFRMFRIKKKPRFRIGQTITLSETALKDEKDERLSLGLKKSLSGHKFTVVKVIPFTLSRLGKSETYYYLCIVEESLKEGTEVDCWLEKWFEETE